MVEGGSGLTDPQRTAGYRFLGQAFAYPDAGFVDRIRQALLTLSPAASLEGEEASLAEEAESLAALPLDQVQGEYTRLFINGYPQLPCPPYESAYREKTLLGQATGTVYDQYRQWGLEVDGALADHVGAELEFMAFLTGLPADGETRAAQRAFLEDHLLAWLPRFAADVQQHARLGFYRALGRALASFLEREQAWLGLAAASAE